MAIEYSSPGMLLVRERQIAQYKHNKHLITTNLEDNICLTECVNRALNVTRYTIHTGLKMTPIEFNHGGNPRTELKNVIKDGKPFLSNWS